MTEEVKALEEDIEAVKDKIEDPVMCEKIRQFVYAPKDIQDLYKTDAGSSFHKLQVHFALPNYYLNVTS